MPAPDIIRGSKNIAYELEVSPATFFRLRKQRTDLPLRRRGSGGRTSELEVRREDLEKFKLTLKG